MLALLNQSFKNIFKINQVNNQEKCNFKLNYGNIDKLEIIYDIDLLLYINRWENGSITNVYIGDDKKIVIPTNYFSICNDLEKNITIFCFFIPDDFLLSDDDLLNIKEYLCKKNYIINDIPEIKYNYGK